MTITTERPTVAAQGKDPRELVSPEVFEKLVSYIVEHQSVTKQYASDVIEQTVIYLKAAASNPGIRLAMDETVDPGWHAFILHSADYEAFCADVAGRYLHHVPPPPGGSVDDATIARTLPALRATGYPVKEEFWVNNKPCCPPDPCVC